MFAQQMSIKAYVSPTFKEKIQWQFLRGKNSLWNDRGRNPGHSDCR